MLISWNHGGIAYDASLLVSPSAIEVVRNPEPVLKMFRRKTEGQSTSTSTEISQSKSCKSAATEWWLWMRWHGFPYPLRLYFWLFYDKNAPKEYPGCGCIVKLKNIWKAIRQSRRIMTHALRS